MTTTGTYNASFENADFITEAWERIGRDPDSITGRHVSSALRSSQLLLTEWATKGVRLWKVETLTYTSSNGFGNGISTITLPSNVIRILSAVHRRNDVDVPVYEIGRDEYAYLHDKTLEGDRPDRYWLDRQRDAGIMNLWPIPDNNNDSLILTVLIRAEDVGTMSNTPDIPILWWEAMAAGLSAKLAEKFAPDRLAEKTALAQEAFRNAKMEDRETASTTIVPYFGRRWNR